MRYLDKPGTWIIGMVLLFVTLTLMLSSGIEEFEREVFGDTFGDVTCRMSYGGPTEIVWEGYGKRVFKLNGTQTFELEDGQTVSVPKSAACVSIPRKEN